MFLNFYSWQWGTVVLGFVLIVNDPLSLYDLQGVMLYLKYFYKASLWGWHWVTFKSGNNFLEQVNNISWFQIQEKVQWKESDIYKFYFFLWLTVK